MNPEYISIYWFFAKLSFSLEVQYQTVFIRLNIEKQFLAILQWTISMSYLILEAFHAKKQISDPVSIQWLGSGSKQIT